MKNQVCDLALTLVSVDISLESPGSLCTFVHFVSYLWENIKKSTETHFALPGGLLTDSVSQGFGIQGRSGT